MKKTLFLIGLLGCGISLVAMKWPEEEQEVPAAAKAQRNEPGMVQEPVEQQQPRELFQATREHIEWLREMAARGEFSNEIAAKILISLAQVKVAGTTEEQKLYNAIANIHAFMEAFPQFYGDVQINREIIQKLANRYARGNAVKVAVALATTGAGQWLKVYVSNNARMKDNLIAELVHAANGQLGTVRFILQYVPGIINSTFGSNTALMIAAENGHTAVVERLLQVADINVNARSHQGITALMYAAANGYAAIVERLLQVAGINVNAQNYQDFTALMIAAENGHMAVVERLLRVAGINVNTRNHQGITALMYAAGNGNAAIVEGLLGVVGIDVNARNQMGFTALMYAADNGHAAIVERLSQVAGINVNAQDQQGGTALMFAVRGGDPAIVERLLQAQGIDVNAQSHQGYTALMIAAGHGHTAVVERLLQIADINVNARARNGKTALQFVRELNSPNKEAIIKLLRDHGATE